MSLLQVQDGDKITMKVGEKNQFTLKGNPTTGYSWIVLENNHVTAEIKYVQSESEQGMVGVGGKFFIEFTATEIGEGKLVLVYRRPWAPNPNDTQFTLNITVQ